MPLSDNGKETIKFVVTEVGRWVIAALAVLTLYVQQHNQHVERMGKADEARSENSAALKAIETKLDGRRPVFGAEK